MTNSSRPSLIDEHPVVLRRYRIPTPSIAQFYALLVRCLTLRTGAMVDARSRVGKTYAILFLESLLASQRPALPILRMRCQHKRIATETAFFSALQTMARHKASPGQSGMRVSTCPAMSEPESDDARGGAAEPLPWLVGSPVSVARRTTYATRAAWTCAVESAWSRFAKFQLLNRLNWTQLGEALAIQPTISTSEGIDLRAADAFRLTDLADTLHIGQDALDSSFTTTNRKDALLDAASASLRFCPTCASAGFHATLFQFVTFRRCPIHKCALRDACPGCGQPLAYRLHAGLVCHP